MSWHQLRAILWLRFRLAQNAIAKSSKFGQILALALAVIGAIGALSALLAPLLLARPLLDRVSPTALMMVWDILVAGFGFFWLIGLATELQRSETLSLSKLLHLPVSPTGGFLLNYVSSSVTLSLLIFGSLMTGLAIAQIGHSGPIMLLTLPLVVALLVMVTAVGYQIRGWLAQLMSNKRRRGTVLAFLLFGLILLGQTPTIIQFAVRGNEKDFEQRRDAAIAEVDAREESGQLTPEEADTERLAVEAGFDAEEQERDKANQARTRLIGMRANQFVPLGWLPYGVRGLAQGNVGPALLGLVGMATIGGLSLRSSYRSTLQLYRRGGPARKRRKRAEPAPSAAPTATWLDRDLPGLSEDTSGVVLAAIRGFLRAPQAKLLLLTPLILIVLLGSLMVSGDRASITPQMASLAALGVVLLAMLTLSNFAQNAFGFDRDGFRAYVLSPVPRRQILLGRNVALLPFFLAIGLPGLILVTIAMPLRFDHFIGTLFQFASVFFLCCSVGNLTSIYGPIAMSESGMKPAEQNLQTALRQIVFGLVFMSAMVPAILPLGIELLLERLQADGGLPIYLLLSVVEAAALLLVYRWALRAEGRMLRSREELILRQVGSRLDG